MYFQQRTDVEILKDGDNQLTVDVPRLDPVKAVTVVVMVHREGAYENVYRAVVVNDAISMWINAVLIVVCFFSVLY